MPGPGLTVSQSVYVGPLVPMPGSFPWLRPWPCSGEDDKVIAGPEERVNEDVEGTQRDRPGVRMEIAGDRERPAPRAQRPDRG